MPVLDDLPPELAPALAALTARLKHDLGKYIAFAARWLPEHASAKDQLEALTADLLHTRRGPDGIQDATSVWQAYAGVLTGAVPLDGQHTLDLSDDPDVHAIEQAMTDLEPVVAALRSDDPVPADLLARGLDLSREVSTRCRTLHRRAHEATSDHG